jgi:hypothetical protein
VDYITPAVSLNVRQAIRVNYGQFKFVYPPLAVDGISYRSTLEAVVCAPQNSPQKKKDKNKKVGFSSHIEINASRNTSQNDISANSLKISADLLESKVECDVKLDSETCFEAESTSTNGHSRVPATLVSLLSNVDLLIGASTAQNISHAETLSKNVDVSLPPDSNIEIYNNLSDNDLSNLQPLSSPNESKSYLSNSYKSSDHSSGENDSDDSSEESSDSDEENEDEENEDEEDASNSRAVHENDLNPELELRRQALIENLIGIFLF